MSKDGVERVSRDDMEAHEKVLARVAATRAIFEFWSEYLAEKYQLAEGDQIERDGRITRSTE